MKPEKVKRFAELAQEQRLPVSLEVLPANGNGQGTTLTGNAWKIGPNEMIVGSTYVVYEDVRQIGYDFSSPEGEALLERAQHRDCPICGQRTNDVERVSPRHYSLICPKGHRIVDPTGLPVEGRESYPTHGRDFGQKSIDE
jgi:hypothetical protein